MLRTQVIGLLRKSVFILLTVAGSCVGLDSASADIVLNPNNGHYYESVAGGITWDDANTAASARRHAGLPGHLATITSKDEQSFLSKNLTSGNLFFIGGLQVPDSLEPDGGWTWVTGEIWDYTAWESGEPNDRDGEDRLQWYSSPKGWNDVSGTRDYPGYIVEYEAVPEPSSLVPFAIAGLLLMVYTRVNPGRRLPKIR